MTGKGHRLSTFAFVLGGTGSPIAAVFSFMGNTFPDSSVTARSFMGLVVISGTVSLVCFVLGLVLSFMVNLPAGAGVILVNTLILVIVRVIA